jgi:hypothetical protein
MTELLEQVDRRRPRSVSPEYARAKQKSTVTVTRHGAGDGLGIVQHTYTREARVRNILQRAHVGSGTLRS